MRVYYGISTQIYKSGVEISYIIVFIWCSFI